MVIMPEVEVEAEDLVRPQPGHQEIGGGIIRIGNQQQDSGVHFRIPAIRNVEVNP